MGNNTAVRDLPVGGPGIVLKDKESSDCLACLARENRSVEVRDQELPNLIAQKTGWQR
jgi:hypothetical protein